MGPAIGRGAVWLNESVKANTPSDSYLFGGYAHRAVWLRHDEPVPVIFTLEVDVRGDNQWTKLREVEIPAHSTKLVEFSAEQAGAWVRLAVSLDCAKATAYFQSRADDPRPAQAPEMFDGIARPGETNVSGGLLHALGGNRRKLAFAMADSWYDLDGELNLIRNSDEKLGATIRAKAAIPTGVVSSDAASALYVDELGRRWRLPKGDPAFDAPGTLGDERVDREVVTERDLFNCHGTFYELPAESSGGFGKIRPIATHNRRIKDYATYRGLLFISGIAADAKGTHIIRSADGKAALWAGAIDDLWKFGKPQGLGGPWKETAVKAGEPSDPYLVTGYDRKRLSLRHASAKPVRFRLEADLTGTGDWCEYMTLEVKPGESMNYTFPAAFAAYWLRFIPESDTNATAQLVYE